MADKRISQLVERVNIANNDVLPIVASGATTTNKVTVSTLQDWMQSNLDVGVTSVGLSMPSAFVVSNSPVTASGNISVTGAGTVSQYIRGDGSLADFPSGGGGGGSSVNYYLNGSVSQGTIGGIAYQEMNRTPILGAGTDFTIAADGYIASFITDAGDPALLEIPAGNWNFETYLQASSGGGTPSFYIELYKVNSGGTATLIASNSATPELIAFGTTTTPYFSALAVPTTSLTLTDRLALRYYVTHSGRTITLHTENTTLCQIVTTFTTGLTALNGLTAQVQNFATGTSGTDFAISSSVSTHTFNLPNASASARGVVSTGTQTFAGAKTFNSDIIVNGITVGKGGASNGNNTAIGANSLSSNTTGTLNTATGLSALAFNTAGNSNTANGANSLVANTTGGFNTAIGSQSLYSNTTGQANTAIGLNSLYSNTTGTYNIGVGSGAGYYIADGSTPNTTSDFSIYLGADTKASVDNAQNEVVIGYNAIGSGSNTVTIGNSSVTDNYFTGTIRSTALRLAAAGTADTTIFRNTSGTSSSTGSANVVGFNGSNNIFVTTNSKGGFLLDFNNSVSNRTYTLQDASGTLAFTSQIPSVVGVYLPLTGGTLTGALNGTSASFTGAVNLATSSGNVGIGINPSVWSNANKAVQIGLGGAISSRTAINNVQISSNYFRNSSLVNTYINTDFASLYEQTNGGHFFFTAPSGTAGNAISFTQALSLASTGAATFSSSVTAKSLKIENTGVPSFLYFNNTSAPASNYIALGSAANEMYFQVNGADRIVIKDNGNVGIGTALPSSWTKLQVDGTAGAQTEAAQQLHIAAPTTTVGHGAGIRLNAASGAKEAVGIIGIVNEASGNLGAMTFHTYGGGANIPERMRITSGGQVQIGGSTGAYIDFVGTTASFYGGSGTNTFGLGAANVNWYQGDSLRFYPTADNSRALGLSSNRYTAVWAVNGTIQTSDEREKKDIIDSDLGLDFVNKLRPVSFKWKVGQNMVTTEVLKDEEGNPILDEEGKEKTESVITPREGIRTHYGLIAQEVEELLDGKDFGGFIHDEETDIKGLRYDQFVPLLIKAIQEQQIQIDSLKNQIK